MNPLRIIPCFAEHEVTYDTSCLLDLAGSVVERLYRPQITGVALADAHGPITAEPTLREHIRQRNNLFSPPPILLEHVNSLYKEGSLFCAMVPADFGGMTLFSDWGFNERHDAMGCYVFCTPDDVQERPDRVAYLIAHEVGHLVMGKGHHYRGRGPPSRTECVMAGGIVTDLDRLSKELCHECTYRVESGTKGIREHLSFEPAGYSPPGWESRGSGYEEERRRRIW